MVFACQGEQGDRGEQGGQGIQGEQGEKGDRGEQGQQGEQGEQGNQGQKGESAYDLFIKYNPDYIGDEEQWVQDLVYGRLVRFTITFKAQNHPDVVYSVLYGYDLPEIPEVPYVEDYTGEWESFSSTNITQNATINAIYTSIYSHTQGLQYTLINGDTEYAVSGIGTATDTDIVIPSIYNIKPVTTIGDVAFVSCTSLTSITIPDSVTVIGNLAFYDCINLTSITIPDSVTIIGISAFSYCTNLTSVTIGNPVTTIGNLAFNNCTSLPSVTIGNSVTTIGNLAFNNCDSLISVTIPNSVTSIEINAFYKTAMWNNTSNNSVVYADKWAVDYKGVLDVVVLRDDTVGIADYSFYDCTNLTSITIPNSVATIGEGGIQQLRQPNINHNSKFGCKYGRLCIPLLHQSNNLL